MAKQEEGTPVDLTQRVTVYATDKNLHAKTGEEIIISAHLVDHLVETGMVTKTAPKKEGGK